MTKESVPDTHKLLEHLDVLVMEYNGKLRLGNLEITDW